MSQAKSGREPASKWRARLGKDGQARRAAAGDLGKTVNQDISELGFSKLVYLPDLSACLLPGFLDFSQISAMHQPRHPLQITDQLTQLAGAGQHPLAIMQQK